MAEQITSNTMADNVPASVAHVFTAWRKNAYEQGPEEEINLYAIHVLGMKDPEESIFRGLAKECYGAPLPSPWKEYTAPYPDDGVLSVFYFNEATGATTWEDPTNDLCAKFYKQVRSDAITAVRQFHSAWLLARGST